LTRPTKARVLDGHCSATLSFVLQAAAIGGIRAILVHAISGDAKRFYERSGFSASRLDPMTLMIIIADAEKALSGK
jgi:hypothetical protein